MNTWIWGLMRVQQPPHPIELGVVRKKKGSGTAYLWGAGARRRHGVDRGIRLWPVVDPAVHGMGAARGRSEQHQDAIAALESGIPGAADRSEICVVAAQV